ncbi:MAG: SDR family oxidoreductase [Desulfuromonadales bacterium]|nr:SDR family oxidoreductase [Desulfuromonadales bacterium]
MQEVVIIGCGDIGCRVGQQLIEQGKEVLALAHTQKSAVKLREKGFSTLIGDLDYRADTPEIPLHGRQMFYLAPPQGGGKSDYRMLNFCRKLSPGNTPAKVVYISTSGVYGDCGGDIVTEERPINPQTARAMRRASAENQLQEQAEKLGFALVILRVTGIYGPGRLPVARIRQGHPVLKKGEGSYTNRVHTLDLVQVCLAAMEKGEHGDVFNVCDGQESSMTDYFLAVADLCDLPRPKEIGMAEAEKEMNPLMLSYLKESRRMSNRKMLDKLAVKLLYPTLADGLKASRGES